MIELRDLHSVAECRAVVAIQEAVWGAGSEIVPASVLVASAKRGGILIGAVDGSEVVGFVWSMPGWRDRQPTQWSHMLGVLPNARGQRLGERLKLAQRDRALTAGLELIEWTFDPLQALNAHLNLSALGCTVGTYLVDAYGDMRGHLHRGTATDRFIAEWWIQRLHVVRRIERLALDESMLPLVARSAELVNVPVAVDTVQSDGWLACTAVRQNLEVPRLLVPIPPNFTEMQRDATDLAEGWRRATRDVFLNYFGRGYRAVDFFLNREDGGGHYLLANQAAT